LPYVTVGDEAFLLRRNLLRPCLKTQAGENEQKAIFNYQLRRACRVSENCYGILTQKFQLIQYWLWQNHKNIYKIILASCVMDRR
jgi:hypothetical protein